jgi:exo-beta-1,3-glucanase (GH17 family)
MHKLEAHPMKHSFFGPRSIRAALAGLLAVVLVACGGGGTTPVTGVAPQQIRPLSADFTARKAISYSPFRTSECERPDQCAKSLSTEIITKVNIKQDLDLVLAAGYRLIRLYDPYDNTARQTLEVIRDNNLNLKVYLGVTDIYPGADAANRALLARLVTLANEFKSIVLVVSVGNENMVEWSFKRMAPAVMADYIKTVRDQITQPVTTNDNYKFWASVPTVITDVIDFAALHTYAELDTYFDPTRWDWKFKDVPAAQRAAAMMDGAIAETKRQYNEGRSFLDSRGLTYMPMIIGETGWNAVNLGRLNFRAHPVNQKMFHDRLAAWAEEGKTGAGPKAIAYFVAFDEKWKQSDDGWGVFNKDRQARYVIQAFNRNNSPAGSATWVWEPGSYTDADAVYFKPAVVNTAITANRYTLFSDLAIGASEVRPTGLVWDAFDGNTVFAPEVATAFAPGDGPNSIEITPTPASFGWGFLRQSRTGVTDNLSGYVATGTLNFWISTTYPGKIEIGIGTDTVDREAQEAYLLIQPGNYGYCSTGAWCQVSIPLKDFIAKNPKLDLSLVLSRFIISDVYSRTGNAPGSTAKLYIDGIYWSK